MKDYPITQTISMTQKTRHQVRTGPSRTTRPIAGESIRTSAKRHLGAATPH